MKKILVINVNWLGDVVFSSPVFKALRDNFPQSRITCMAVPRVIEVLKCIPEIDDLIVYDENGRHAWPWAKIGLILQIKRERFDAVFILHGSLTRALIAQWAGIPIRVGYGTKKRGHLLTHEIAFPSADRHRADQYLGVIEGFGIKINDRKTRLNLKESLQGEVLKKFGLDPKRKYVVVNPGGNWDLKRWPSENYKMLVENLTRAGNLVVITGGAGDKSLAEEIASGVNPRPKILAGVTSLSELMIVLQSAAFVISADSGPSHLANSLGADTLVIFGPTRPEITGPRGIGRLKIIQDELGCNKRSCYYLKCQDNVCMRSITVQRVLDAIQEFQNQ